MQKKNIIAPEHIRFSCSSCGNCCLTWPVPLTATDQERITDLPASLFVPYSNSSAKMQAFSFLMQKRPDGKCYFLTENNRCELHENFGPEKKPSMCRLFPFTFMETPDDIRAGVSFNSTAVLLNYGDLLSEQTSLLQEQHTLFEGLFPGLKPDWQNLQLADGLPMRWDDFRQTYDPLVLLAGLRCRTDPAEVHTGITEKLPVLCQKLYETLPQTLASKLKAPKLASPAKIQDQLLLKYFQAFYGTASGSGNAQQDIDSKRLTAELINAPNIVEITFEEKSLRVSGLLDFRLKSASPEFIDLVDRFVYNRLFSLLYFGYGFAGLSLLAGLGHLSLLASLMRLAAKAKLLAGPEQADFLELAGIVRLVEAKLTHANYSAATSSIIEVLLTDWQRISRIATLGH